jgi:hypothetical protein
LRIAENKPQTWLGELFLKDAQNSQGALAGDKNNRNPIAEKWPAPLEALASAMFPL